MKAHEADRLLSPSERRCWSLWRIRSPRLRRLPWNRLLRSSTGSLFLTSRRIGVESIDEMLVMQRGKMPQATERFVNVTLTMGGGQETSLFFATSIRRQPSG
jgi:hypothetical protein